MLATSLHHSVLPVGVLLGGSGMRHIVTLKRPDVAALLQPRTGFYATRTVALDAVAPSCEADCPILTRERTWTTVIAMAVDDPNLVLKQM